MSLFIHNFSDKYNNYFKIKRYKMKHNTFDVPITKHRNRATFVFNIVSFLNDVHATIYSDRKKPRGWTLTFGISRFNVILDERE